MAEEFKKAIKVVFDWKYDSLEEFKEGINKSLTLSLRDGIKSLKADFAAIFTDAFRNAITEMQNMLEYSQLSSAQTREMAFGYGLSSAEAYGFEKALKAVGLSSEEDLFYANTQELKQFREAFEKYSTQYSELYDSGFFEQMQEYQFEMADFKNEMSLEVVKFFMENKDTIKAGMKAIMSISEVILKIFGFLTSGYGASLDTMSTSDILNQYSEVKNSSTNVNINNNFNGVSKNDESWLADMGNATYSQIIKALGGSD